MARALVTGGTGLIGIPLVHKLVQLGYKVTAVSLDSTDWAKIVLPACVEYYQLDLTDLSHCNQIVVGQDCVFQLCSFRGPSPNQPYRVAQAYRQFTLVNTHMLHAAYQAGVSRYLLCGSICEYPPLPVRSESDVWDGAPAQNDRYTGIAKRSAEAMAEAYQIEYGWDAVRIVRPANVFGPYDDFDLDTAQVIPALIRRVAGGDNPLRVQGDGKAQRDFVYADDIADGMLRVMAYGQPNTPVNLGAGRAYSIREIAATIAGMVSPQPDIEWDTDAATGDAIRMLDSSRAFALGWRPQPIADALRKTLEWYRHNRTLAHRRGADIYGKAMAATVG